MGERNDIVDELDWWMSTGQLVGLSGLTGSVQRARHEIVALREMRDAHVRILSANLDEDEEKMQQWIAKARNGALEEAEIACLTEARDYVISLGQDNYRDGCRNCAAAIRALKDKSDG